MIRFNNSIDGMQLCAATGSVFSAPSDQCIARVEKGVLYGGVTYNGYTGVGGSVNIHMTGFRPHWVNKDLLWVSFHYPFVQLGVKKLFGQVPMHKSKVLKFDLQLGFKLEATIKDVYPEGDMALLYSGKDWWSAVSNSGTDDEFAISVTLPAFSAVKTNADFAFCALWTNSLMAS